MIHIAIVSHGHEDLLILSNLCGLNESNERLKIWIKDNRPSVKFKHFCQEKNVTYFDEQPGLGFGCNNNYLFKKIQQSVGFLKDDTFVVMNPDITISIETVEILVEKMQLDQCKLATLNLFRDQKFLEPDANIRQFPNLYSLARAAGLRSISKKYDKTRMKNPSEVDWASGAFLVFNAEHYAQLKGFEPRYFMYFEDVDICYRSRQLIEKGVYYYPLLKATHLAAHRNRTLLSKHSFWFFKSFLLFLSLRYFSYDKHNFHSRTK